MNNKLVQDETFVEAVNTCAGKIFGSDEDANFAIKWELFKQEVKMKALERSGAIKK